MEGKIKQAHIYFFKRSTIYCMAIPFYVKLETSAPLLKPSTWEYRPMPPKTGMEEPLWKTRTYGILACAFIAFFFYYHASLLKSAHYGVDQNGYIVGGKMIYDHGSMAYSPINPISGKLDPFLYVGRMWVGTGLGTDNEKYYPKYPFGLPLIYASVLKTAGFEKGRELIYWTSPVCMALSLAATFLLIRMLTSSFMALLATVAMSSSPLLMGLTNNPNSHASALFCVTWGMYLLFSWWQRGGWARALFAGLFLGYSVTIRYTEGTLLLTLLFVVALSWPALKPRFRYYCESALLILGWALPVLVLAIHNLIAFKCLTGYDPTNESTGFTLEYFQDNWETMFRQLDSTSLFLLFPLAIGGLTAMFWWSWRVGVVLASWILPCILVYTAYYWAPDGLGYARFFLTIIPGMTLCAFWMLSRLGNFDGIGQRENPVAEPDCSRLIENKKIRIAAATAGILTVLSLLVNLNTATVETVDDSIRRSIQYDNTRDMMQIARPGSVIICPDSNFLNHLQFVSDYQLYSSEPFERDKIQKLPDMDPDEPQALQPQRRQALYERLKNYSQPQLSTELRNIVSAALENGREVYFIKREDKPMRIKDSRLRPFRESDILSVPPDIRNPVQALPRWLIPPEVFDTKLVLAWQNQSASVKDMKEKKPRGRKPTAVQLRESQQRQNWVVLKVTLKEKTPTPQPAAKTRTRQKAETVPTAAKSTSKQTVEHPAQPKQETSPQPPSGPASQTQPQQPQ
ncbi:MAG: glycosyltransferase family 39 protein [Victivallales bacterium]|jgi:hypothetical protein